MQLSNACFPHDGRKLATLVITPLPEESTLTFLSELGLGEKH